MKNQSSAKKEIEKQDDTSGIATVLLWAIILGAVALVLKAVGLF